MQKPEKIKNMVRVIVTRRSVLLQQTRWSVQHAFSVSKIGVLLQHIEKSW